MNALKAEKQLIEMLPIVKSQNHIEETREQNCFERSIGSMEIENGKPIEIIIDILVYMYIHTFH